MKRFLSLLAIGVGLSLSPVLADKAAAQAPDSRATRTGKIVIDDNAGNSVTISSSASGIVNIPSLSLTGLTQNNVLFGGPSAVVSQSNNFSWNNTTNVLQMGSSGVAATIRLFGAAGATNNVTIGAPAAGGPFTFTLPAASGELAVTGSGTAPTFGEITLGDDAAAGAQVPGKIHLHDNTTANTFLQTIQGATNAGQTTVFTIPDGGAATASFVLTNAAVDQTIDDVTSITNNANIAINPGTANFVTTDGNFRVSGTNRPIINTANGVTMGSDVSGNAGVELNTNSGTPYVDFSNDVVVDFDARLILGGDDELVLDGADLNLDGNELIGHNVANGTLTLVASSNTTAPVGTNNAMLFQVGDYDGPTTNAMTITHNGQVTIPNANITGGTISGVTLSGMNSLSLGTESATPVAGTLALHDGTDNGVAGSAGELKGTLQTATALTVDRTYTFPDASGTVMLTTGNSSLALGDATAPTPGTITLHDNTVGANGVTINTSTITTAGLDYSLPDVGADASFVMTEGAQTINGVKTFQNSIQVGVTAGTINLRDNAGDHNAQIVSQDQTGSHTFTIPNTGGNTQFIMGEANQTINGVKTFGNTITSAIATPLALTNATSSTIAFGPAGTNTFLDIDDGDGNRMLQVNDVGTDGVLTMTGDIHAQWANAGAASGGAVDIRRSKGSYAVPAAVVDNDLIGGFRYFGYDLNSFEQGASITAEVDGSVADGDVPMALVFNTKIDGGAFGERMRIDADGTVNIPDVNITGGSITGVSLSSSTLSATTATNQVTLGDVAGAGNGVTISSVAPAAGDLVYTIPDAGAAASFVMTEGAQTVNGIKTFSANLNATTSVTSPSLIGSTALNGNLTLTASTNTGSNVGTAMTFRVGDADAYINALTIDHDGTVSVPNLAITGTFDGDFTLTKEAAHSIFVAASTTAATAGGALTIAGGAGNGAAGGNVNINGGTGTTSGNVVLNTSGGATQFMGKITYTHTDVVPTALGAIDLSATTAIVVRVTDNSTAVNNNITTPTSPLDGQVIYIVNQDADPIVSGFNMGASSTAMFVYFSSIPAWVRTAN